jgi:hypothetical protein
MKKIIIITGSAIIVIALAAVVLFSCSKEKAVLNNPVLKSSDTCLIKIAYINPNGEAIFDSKTTHLASLFENGMTHNYQNEYPSSEYKVDSMAFMKYFNSIEDTLRADSAHYYLILFGRLTAADTNLYFIKSAIKLARNNNNLFLNICQENGDGPQIIIEHECEGVNCASCDFTYTWSWWIFYGSINGCICNKHVGPNGYCKHIVRKTVHILPSL